MSNTLGARAADAASLNLICGDSLAELFVYRMNDLSSIALHAVNSANIGIPAVLVRYVLRTLRDGYQVGAFRTKDS